MSHRPKVDKRPFMQTVSVEYEGKQYLGSYMYAEGAVYVGWNNDTDFTRHMRSAVSSDPHADAMKLLRQLLLAAKFRGEI